MIGWMLFFTLLVLVFIFMLGMADSFDNAFGYRSKPINIKLIIAVLVFVWIIYLSNKFGIVKFWFQ